MFPFALLSIACGLFELVWRLSGFIRHALNSDSTTAAVAAQTNESIFRPFLAACFASSSSPPPPPPSSSSSSLTVAADAIAGGAGLIERAPPSARAPLLAIVCALLGSGSGVGGNGSGGSGGSSGSSDNSMTEARMFRDHKPSRTPLCVLRNIVTCSCFTHNQLLTTTHLH